MHIQYIQMSKSRHRRQLSLQTTLDISFAEMPTEAWGCLAVGHCPWVTVGRPTEALMEEWSREVIARGNDHDNNNIHDHRPVSMLIMTIIIPVWKIFKIKIVSGGYNKLSILSSIQGLVYIYMFCLAFSGFVYYSVLGLGLTRFSWGFVESDAAFV